MTLPELSLQIIYARLAWALIAAAILLSVLPTMLPKLFPALAQRTKLIVLATLLVVMALPGAVSPAYSLTLVFQYPSGLLTGYALVAICSRWSERPVNFLLHPLFALVLTVLGVVLYLDAFGVLALGLYYRGFDADAAAVLACISALAAALAYYFRFAVSGGAALMSAVVLFSLARLPTGNLWDALLDPLLWAWALGSVIVAAMRYHAARKTVVVAQPELALAHGVGIEELKYK